MVLKTLNIRGGKAELLFDGRTVIAEFSYARDENTNPNAVGDAIRHLARGPKARMAVVLQREDPGSMFVNILVNTDESPEDVRARLSNLSNGDESNIKCRLATPEDETDLLWEKTIALVKQRNG